MHGVFMHIEGWPRTWNHLYTPLFDTSWPLLFERSELNTAVLNVCECNEKAFPSEGRLLIYIYIYVLLTSE